MDDIIEARLGMSLDDLIKEQKGKIKPQKKKPVLAKGGVKNTNTKAGNRRPAPGRQGQHPTRPGNNPNQRPPNPHPGQRGPQKPGALKATKGGRVQKKGGAGPTAMRIDSMITGNKAGRIRTKNSNNNPNRPGSNPGPLGGRNRPPMNVSGNGAPHNTNTGRRPGIGGGGNIKNQDNRNNNNMQHRGKGVKPNNNPHHHHQQQHQQQPMNPNKQNKNIPRQPQQQQQQQQQPSQQYNTYGAPPGFSGPPPSHRHNPYQDALYAKSQKPLFARFEDLQRVPMDKMAVATLTQQPEFIAGPMNKHGVRLPV